MWAHLVVRDPTGAGVVRASVFSRNLLALLRGYVGDGSYCNNYCGDDDGAKGRWERAGLSGEFGSCQDCSRQARQGGGRHGCCHRGGGSSTVGFAPREV